MARGLEMAAGKHAGHHALRFGDSHLTYGELDRLSNAYAHQLQAQGIAAGQRVVLMTANRPEFVVAVYAISKLHAAAVLLSPAWKAREVAHALQITGAGYAIADSDTGPLLGETLGADRVANLDELSLLDATGEAGAPDPG